MSNSFLSQDEIDSLLKGSDTPEEDIKPQDENLSVDELKEDDITDLHKD